MSGSRLCWLRLDYELELTHEDRVRLASQLGAQEWLDVMRAFRQQDRVSIERRDGFSWRPGQPSPDMTLVVNVLDSFDDWIGRLARFAHARNPDRLDPAPVIQAYADTKRAPAGTQPGCR